MDVQKRDREKDAVRGFTFTFTFTFTFHIHIHIHIIIVRNDLDMTITVKNTGPGISPERLKQLQYLLAHPKERATMTSENNGRSIFNTSDRLKIFYGDGYYFSIESEPGKETTCSIRIHR